MTDDVQSLHNNYSGLRGIHSDFKVNILFLTVLAPRPDLHFD